MTSRTWSIFKNSHSIEKSEYKKVAIKKMRVQKYLASFSSSSTRLNWAVTSCHGVDFLFKLWHPVWRPRRRGRFPNRHDRRRILRRILRLPSRRKVRPILCVPKWRGQPGKKWDGINYYEVFCTCSFLQIFCICSFLLRHVGSISFWIFNIQKSRYLNFTFAIYEFT